MKRKIALTLALLVLSFGMVIGANAQKGKLFKGVDWKKMAEAARNGNTNADKDTLARIEEAYNEKTRSFDKSSVFTESLISVEIFFRRCARHGHIPGSR